MNEQPLVSIVTPSFNQAQYIEQTILSVLNQSYKKIEYIIIDGGSTDGSVDIIKRYAGNLKYWVSEKDNGQTDAINKGIDKCKGEIIAYLNSDDVYMLDAVQKIVEAYILNKNAAVYYGLCETIDEIGNTVKSFSGGQTSFAILQSKSMVPLIYQPACFFNAKFAKRRPLFTDNYCLDYELLLHLSTYFPMLFINKPIAKYRVHSLAITSQKQDAIYLEKLKLQLRYGGGLYVKWNLLKFYIKRGLGLTKGN